MTSISIRVHTTVSTTNYGDCKNKNGLAFHTEKLGKSPGLTSSRGVSDTIKLIRKNSDAAAASPSKNKKKMKKKRVRFQAKDDNAMIDIPRWRDLPPEQVAAIWWTPDEMEGLKRDWKGAVYKIDQGETLAQGETPRGLEQYTKDGAWEYHIARLAGFNAVLDEQDHQSSEEDIAKAYKDETKKYVQKAIERAKLDAKEAEKLRLTKAEGLQLLKDASKSKTKHNKKKKKPKT